MENLENKGKPFALIGVNIFQQQPEALKKVMAQEKITWRSFVNTDRAISRQWNSPGTPTYYVIDHLGTIRHKWTGNPGAKSLDQILDRMIAEAQQATPAK